jgi:hypothetical protein
MIYYFIITSVIQLTIEPQEVRISTTDLGRAILDAEAALKAVSVTCDYKLQTFSLTNKQLLSPVMRHGVCSFDSTGRCRYEGFGDLRDGSDKRSFQERNIAAFNGSRMKAMTGDKQRYLRGRVSENSGMPWPLDPREYLYRFAGNQVGKTIMEEGSQITGWINWDRRKVIAAETKIYPGPEGSDKTKIRFYIDPDRGFSIVRRSFAIFKPGSNEWFDYNVIEGYDYNEISPGIWVPSLVKWNSYGASSTELSPLQIGRHEIRNSNWVINAKLPDTYFDLEFEPGIIVTDEQSGKIYQTVNLNEDQIASQVAEGIEIYHEQQAGSSRKTVLWATGGVLGVGLLVLAGIVLRKRLRRFW